MAESTALHQFVKRETQLRALEAGTLSNPFQVLGPERLGEDTWLRSYQPNALKVEAISPKSGAVLANLQPAYKGSGVWIGKIPGGAAYRLRIQWPDAMQEIEDPYRFGPLLGDVDIHLLAEGRHYELNRCLGAQPMVIDGCAGVRFAVWAPNARRVSVLGDFNHWDSHRHPMRPRESCGIWELFIPGVKTGHYYKYEVLGKDGLLPLKADPVGWQSEAPPGNASIVADHKPVQWQDDAWMAQRSERQSHRAPVSIYELHGLSWRRLQQEGNRSLTWDELGDELIPYVKRLGFTHIELLPVTAHPFRGSWGYQPIGLFAPYAEAGEPKAFARFIERCHQAELGVIVDWVPAHFPTDPHGLMRFDGTALYEHEDIREGFQQDWNTLIYNLGRTEVHEFLIASALHWLEVYHIDGLRVDAVASMLYRDYSRKEGEWIPNQYGGRENLESIDFIRHLNSIVAQRCPGAMIIAEESTAWPGVSHPIEEGGLGFSFKWNMGWMNDSLSYIRQDPVHRAWHHDKITFGLHYAFSERFVLPLSHDEVVHGKGSMLGKMPGDRWQRFANLRSYYGFMWAHPGKKLLFMGGEIAQISEWNHDAEVEWPLLDDPLHSGVQLLIGDLNSLYRNTPALHLADCDSTGFTWLIGDDKNNSVFTFYRSGLKESTPPVLVICNFTPVPHYGYRVGAPRLGFWREALNTDAECYGGSNRGNRGGLRSVVSPCHGQSFSFDLTVPPLATVFFVFDESSGSSA